MTSPIDASGLPTEPLARIGFALGVSEAEAPNIIRRLADAGLMIVRGWQPIDGAPIGDELFIVHGDTRTFVVRGSILENARLPSTPEHLSMRYLTHRMPLPEPPA